MTENYPEFAHFSLFQVLLGFKNQRIQSSQLDRLSPTTLLTYAGIDVEFEKLLANMFGREFIETYKLRRPSGWTDLMVAFESRKRSASPNKSYPLNVCLPFSFIEQYKKLRVTPLPLLAVSRQTQIPHAEKLVDICMMLSPGTSR